MMIDTTKQTQNAGDGSNQYQIETLNVYQGMTEGQVRNVFEEMIPLALQTYTKSSYELANSRICQLEAEVMPRLQSVDGLVEAFADPAFQILLRKAQQSAAATEREDDYKLLSELLICHVEKGEDRKNRAGISKAVEIIDQIDNDALCALTLSHVLMTYYPITGNCLVGLKVMDSLYRSLLYQELPIGSSWLDHLDILGAIRCSPIGNMKKISEYCPTILSGYVCVGLKNDSAKYNAAKNLLTSANLRDNLLVPNDCLEGYSRLEIRNIRDIEKETFIDEFTLRPYSENQIRCLKSIFNSYICDPDLKKQAENRFMELWNSFESLRKMRTWWDEIPHAFEITQVGRILAYVNAKRCNSGIPDLI